MVSKYRTMFSGFIASNALIVRFIIGAKFRIDMMISFPLFFFLAVAGCSHHKSFFLNVHTFFYDVIIAERFCVFPPENVHKNMFFNCFYLWEINTISQPSSDCLLVISTSYATPSIHFKLLSCIIEKCANALII